MSDEYRVRITGAVSLDSIAQRLSSFGLRVVKSSGESLWMAYDGTDAEQLRRWGGNAGIERDEEGLFITLNATKDRKLIIKAIQDALISQGVSANIEEV